MMINHHERPNCGSHLTVEEMNVKIKFIEAVHYLNPRRGQFCNHGKFLVGQFQKGDFSYRSAVDGFPLLGSLGHAPNHFCIIDLATGEGFITPKGLAIADLSKHRVWVCPMFPSFLEALYEKLPYSSQESFVLEDLPSVFELPNAPGDIYGWRWGEGEKSIEAWERKKAESEASRTLRACLNKK